MKKEKKKSSEMKKALTSGRGASLDSCHPRPFSKLATLLRVQVYPSSDEIQ